MRSDRLRRAAGWRRRAAPVVDDYAQDFKDSRDYWERRYAQGGNSGAGSYEELAAFKARTLNAFVQEHGVADVLELGCGDGNQLLLAEYPSYIGLDVASGAIDRCLDLFADDASKSFFLYDPARFRDNAGVFRADLAMSLDVIFHLVEDDVFHAYLDLLFSCGRRFVCIYSSNAPRPDPAPHVRHRQFTDVVSQRFPSWQLVDKVDNPLAGEQEAAVADFYFFAATASA